MEKFFKSFRRILGVGQPQADEEQSQASGGTARPGTKNEKTTGTTRPNPREAGHGKDPARGEEGETPGTWNPEQGCLVVKTERVLEPGSLSAVMIKLAKGQICIEGTDEVHRPKLTITEMIFASSEPEAKGFYKQNGSGVNVRAGPGSLFVKGGSSLGVVSEEPGRVSITGLSGGVIISRSNIGGSVVNRGHGDTVIIDGRQIGPSQSVPRRETQVVLRVPVASEGERVIEVGSGNITVENATGKYDISAGSGKIIIRACDMVKSKIKNGSGYIEVIGTILNSCTITNESGNIEVTDGIFISENTSKNTVKTKAGNISVKFDRDQGEIEVETIQTGLDGGAIQTTRSFFEGVENPNGQTARLILTTQDGEIKVNE